MNKKFITALAVILFISLNLENANSCSTIIAGKKTTADGSLLFGHNEDDYGRRVVNVWRVRRERHLPGSMITLIRGGQLPQIKETWAYTWFQVNDLEFSDYYINEWGVYISSNACRSREDEPELKNGGIGYMLRRLIAERATSAREGVEIAGKLLDEFGYAGSGRTYAICDKNEGWLLSAVNGKHWVARRVPDDQVAFLPNHYIIRRVDFSNKHEYLSSSDNIKEYAIKRGWYASDSGKPFDFAKAYRLPYRQGSKFDQRGFDTRQWRAQAMMTGKAVKIKQAKKTGLPFSVKPNRKLTVSDFQAVLRDHYEGTPYGPADEISTMLPPTSHPGEMQPSAMPARITINPNQTTERTICTFTTVLSIVAQLRSDLPKDIGSVAWISFGRPDCNVYIPWYLGMQEIPAGYNNSPGIADPQLALKYQFDPRPGTFKYDEQAAFWVFNELENVIDPHYPKAMKRVRPVWNDFSSYLMRNQHVVEKAALGIYLKDKQAAVDYLRQYTTAMTAESINKARRLSADIKGFFYH